MVAKNYNQERGLSLVEVIIATAVILIFVVSLVGVHNFYLKFSTSNSDSVSAVMLVEEGAEAVRFLRDNSWSANLASLSLGADYFLAFSSSGWQISAENTLIDGKFSRRFVLNPVYRSPTGAIVSSGGALDPDSKFVTITVSWANGDTTASKSISIFIANLYDN
jgi:uncharacterized membrane protein